MSRDVNKAVGQGDLFTPEAVDEEERTLSRVKRSFREQPSRRKRPNYAADLLELRDSLGEERLDEDRASILEQMHRISRLAAHQAKLVRAEAVDESSPYFGHMVLNDDDGRVRDILIGKHTYVTDRVTIVDWRNAPISRVFYQSEEGDDYELVIAGRRVAGQVETRRTVTIQRGRLLRVSTPDATWVWARDRWHEVSEREPALRGGEGTASRPDRTRPVLGVQGDVPGLVGARLERVDKHLPEIASLLDPEQFELITRPDSGVVAIQGSAGSGKTTVALHRVAFLVYRNPERFSPKRTQIVVGSRALAAYISQVLPALGVDGVPVTSYEVWAARVRRRHFPRLPHRTAEDTPAVVTRVKLHSALVPMLAEAARANPSADVIQLYDELFTSRSWLHKGFAAHAPGAFTEAELDAVHRWCTHLYGLRVDGGDDEEIPRLDAEDDTILLRLYQLLRGRLRRNRTRPLCYAHLVVDEAQDLSPLELLVLMGTVNSGAPITLAGDTAQKIEAADFGDWEQVLATLELDEIRVSPLQTSYRSTAEVMAVAHAVLGPLAPVQPPATTRHGAPVELLRFKGHGEAMTFLIDALRDVVQAEPTASIALLARYPDQAEEAWDALRRAEIPDLRRVRDQDFSFAPGIEVTDIRQTKGLEFDYVIVLDCDSRTYPVTPSSRHLLHVGITRAAHQCWLVSVGTPTRLLPDWLEARRMG